jgi:hypothetical protein
MVDIFFIIALFNDPYNLHLWSFTLYHLVYCIYSCQEVKLLQIKEGFYTLFNTYLIHLRKKNHKPVYHCVSFM